VNLLISQQVYLISAERFRVRCSGFFLLLLTFFLVLLIVATRPGQKAEGVRGGVLRGRLGSGQLIGEVLYSQYVQYRTADEKLAQEKSKPKKVLRISK
jgi:hypothetical protein